MRLPAWSVLLPAWVGTGLLAPFVVAGPLVVASVATEASPVGDGSFEPWVGPVVYSSFGAQAVGITLTFALYARARWSRVLRSRGGCRSAERRAVLASATWVAAGLLAVVAAARLLWALDPAAAAWFGLTDARDTTERAADAAAVAFALMAATGLLMLMADLRGLLRGRPSSSRGWAAAPPGQVGGGRCSCGSARPREPAHPTPVGGWWPVCISCR
jgi:hypothetical protein